jgi:hypothetical protein
MACGQTSASADEDMVGGDVRHWAAGRVGSSCHTLPNWTCLRKLRDQGAAVLRQIARWWSPEFTVTKRQLGWLLVAGGLAVGVLAWWYETTRGGGDFGPSQRRLLAACVAVVLLGLTLVPLGDEPA